MSTAAERQRRSRDLRRRGFVKLELTVKLERLGRDLRDAGYRHDGTAASITKAVEEALRNVARGDDSGKTERAKIERLREIVKRKDGQRAAEAELKRRGGPSFAGPRMMLIPEYIEQRARKLPSIELTWAMDDEFDDLHDPEDEFSHVRRTE